MCTDPHLPIYKVHLPKSLTYAGTYDKALYVQTLSHVK